MPLPFVLTDRAKERGLALGLGPGEGEAEGRGVALGDGLADGRGVADGDGEATGLDDGVPATGRASVESGVTWIPDSSTTSRSDALI